MAVASIAYRHFGLNVLLQIAIFALQFSLCDTWISYDNSSEIPQPIAEGGRNQETVIYNREIANQILGE